MKKDPKLLVVVGLLVAAGLVLFVSPWADSDPDGLSRVAIDKGFADSEREHGLSDSPVAGYAVRGVNNERLSTALSGLIGVIVTFGVSAAGFVWVRKRGTTRRPQADDGESA